METLLPLLPLLALLACPVAMGLMMVFMMPRKKPEHPTVDPREQEITRLRAEIDQLRAELRNEQPAPPTAAEERTP